MANDRSSLARLAAAQRSGRSAATNRPPTVAEAPKFSAEHYQRSTRTRWAASAARALLSSRLAELLLVGIASEEYDAHECLDGPEEAE